MAVPHFSNITCDNMKVKQSCLLLKSNVGHVLKFKYQSLECDKCDLVHVAHLEPHNVTRVIFDFAAYGTAWEVEDRRNTTCKDETYFQEKSSYSLFVNETGCFLTEDKKSSFLYAPLLIALAVYIVIGILWQGCNYLYRKKVWERLLTSRNSLDELAAAYSSSSTIEDTKVKQVRQRLRSLDTVRGIAVVVMIFVNYGGGKYWFFNHSRWNGLTVADLVFPCDISICVYHIYLSSMHLLADGAQIAIVVMIFVNYGGGKYWFFDHTLWNGLTIADLVFPWFIWMMGMSMALSLRSLLRKAIPRRKIFWKIVKRSIILFALGLMLNTYCTDTDLKFLRISGVLQRFSISYLIVATTHLFFAKAEDTNQHVAWASFQDIFAYWMEWLIMMLILAIHLLLTFLLYASGCPFGYLGPGGNHDGGNYSLCTGGAAGYLDRLVLGENHLYKRPSFQKIYDTTLPYDPEGILGYLTSVFLVFLGLQAGKILLTYQTPKSRIIRWLTWSLSTGVLAMILSKVSKNDGWIPINKNLWSVSFIFATGSLAFLLMTICYVVIDVKEWWTGAPFFYSGMNSILLYVGHQMTDNMFPWSWQVSSNHLALLALNLWGTSLWVIISIWAYHINFFVTV